MPTVRIAGGRYPPGTRAGMGRCTTGFAGRFSATNRTVANAERKVVRPRQLMRTTSFPGASADRTRTRTTNPSARSEEHTSELQSLMRISYAVFVLKKKQKHHKT